jgi:hypothetical protein
VPVTPPIDVARYPIQDLERSDTHELTARCRAQLEQTGLCILPGFLLADAVTESAAATGVEVASAFRKERRIAAMDEDEIDAAVPDDDPVRMAHRHAMHVIAHDRIDAALPIRRVYEWDGMTNFLSGVLGFRVHRCADPLLGLVITAMGSGDEQGWHFDDNDFVVSLLLQKAAQGGEFEYVPMIRSEDDPGTERIRAVFDGTSEEVRVAPLEPGTLALFRGTRSLHRVSPVTDEPTRLIALLSYDRHPGMVFPAAVQRNNTGRTTNI